MAPIAQNRKTFERHLPCQWADFKKISQKCTSNAPLPKLLKWFHSAKHNGRQSWAKSRKTFKRYRLLGLWPDFKIISQKCSFYYPLPKLLKWFCLAEQNGHHCLKKKKKKRKKGVTVMHLSTIYLRDIWNNFTEMFLERPSNKIAKMVQLGWIKWPPELKMKKIF